MSANRNNLSIPVRAYRIAYEFVYRCMKGVVTMLSGPLFRVRRVGHRKRLPPGGIIICANHASYLDPPFLQLVVRRRLVFVMTNDFYKRRVGRWFFKLVDAVPIGSGKLARSGLKRAIAHVKRGQAVGIFPEGRLSRDGRPNKAQRGIAIVARRTGATIYPAGIAGSMRAWRHGAKRPRRAHVRVKFGDPVRWDDGPWTPSRSDEQAFADMLLQRSLELKHWIEENAPSPFDEPTPEAENEAPERSDS